MTNHATPRISCVTTNTAVTFLLRALLTAPANSHVFLHTKTNSSNWPSNTSSLQKQSEVIPQEQIPGKLIPWKWTQTHCRSTRNLIYIDYNRPFILHIVAMTLNTHTAFSRGFPIVVIRMIHHNGNWLESSRMKLSVKYLSMYLTLLWTKYSK